MCLYNIYIYIYTLLLSNRSLTTGDGHEVVSVATFGHVSYAAFPQSDNYKSFMYNTVPSPPLYRDTVYRIVGFEVDTKSYSDQSVLSVSADNEKGVPMADVDAKDRDNCKLSDQIGVQQLDKDSKSYVKKLVS